MAIFMQDYWVLTFSWDTLKNKKHLHAELLSEHGEYLYAEIKLSI